MYFVVLHSEVRNVGFSPAVRQWRHQQRDWQSAPPYVQKVVETARRSLYQLRSVEPTVEQTTSTKQSQLGLE